MTIATASTATSTRARRLRATSACLGVSSGRSSATVTGSTRCAVSNLARWRLSEPSEWSPVVTCGIRAIASSTLVQVHWHDLRHEALSRLADDGVPVHELQLLAGHASITTTQRYMNARANSLAESMRKARERRAKRVEQHEEENVQVG